MQVNIGSYNVWWPLFQCIRKHDVWSHRQRHLFGKFSICVLFRCLLASRLLCVFMNKYQHAVMCYVVLLCVFVLCMLSMKAWECVSPQCVRGLRLTASSGREERRGRNHWVASDREEILTLSSLTLFLSTWENSMFVFLVCECELILLDPETSLSICNVILSQMWRGGF